MRQLLFLALWLWTIFPVTVSAGPLDINQATVTELAAALPGIGPAKAEAIVSFRRLNGPIESAEVLLEVKGIGPATLERITPLITFGDTTELSPDGLKRQAAEIAVREKLRKLIHQ
ncbi:MAG: helix-hairpin-helix domain-containing protein [Gammaproteobacteria bacterium]|nr:helix-hairpin-helix domain-containing protein [Gammaproteobacteria bacterium]